MSLERRSFLDLPIDRMPIHQVEIAAWCALVNAETYLVGIDNERNLHGLYYTVHILTEARLAILEERPFNMAKLDESTPRGADWNDNT